MTMTPKRGSDLTAGQTIVTWFGNQTIATLRPYAGTLAHLWNGRAQIAEFVSGSGMTIEPDSFYPVVLTEG